MGRNSAEATKARFSKAVRAVLAALLAFVADFFSLLDDFVPALLSVDAAALDLLCGLRAEPDLVRAFAVFAFAERAVLAGVFDESAFLDGVFDVFDEAALFAFVFASSWALLRSGAASVDKARSAMSQQAGAKIVLGEVQVLICSL